MTSIDKGSIDFKGELLRKSIHLCSLSIPIIYNFISKSEALTILIPITLISVLIDFSRYYIPSLNKTIMNIFGFIMREHENDMKKKNLNGASYVFIAATLTLWIFPKLIFITSFTMLIICDIAAALIGRKFGKHKFLAKSFEGTFAFFLFGIIVVFITPKVEGILLEFIIGIFAGAVGAIVENISYGWADDNLTIPISIGFTMWGLYFLLLPNFIL
ncbi:MAG: dolichol kinase [Ignavibacteriae bacterium]|nr:dolichol kinase [Ignavibacteriota bacterium]